MVPTASVRIRPVTYIEINSVEDDCMKLIPRLPSLAMAMAGKYV